MMLERQEMKNSTDKTWILLSALFPTAGLLWILFATFIGDYRLIPPLIFTILGLVFFLFFIALDLIYRPYEVEVGEKVVLKYHGRTEERSIESLERVFFSPTHGKWYGRRVESHVRFSGDKNAVQVTYEIVEALYDTYVVKTGKAPQLHPRSSTVR
jgi:hypothetical protein